MWPLKEKVLAFGMPMPTLFFEAQIFAINTLKIFCHLKYHAVRKQGLILKYFQGMMGREKPERRNTISHSFGKKKEKRKKH